MKREAVVSLSRGSFLIFILPFLILLAGMLSESDAQEGSKAPRIITLEDALRVAMEKNKDIQKAREYRVQLQGRYVEERAAALPQVVIRAGASRDRDETQKAFGPFYPLGRETWSAGVNVSQVIYSFGQVEAAIRAAKKALSSGEEQLRLYQQAALRDVSASFYDLLLAKELHSLARQNQEQRARHRDEARRKFAAGVATDYDVLAAEVAAENAAPEVIRTANLILTNREKLRFLLGLEGEEVDVQGKLETVFSLYPAYEESVEVAWKKRPEIVDMGYQMAVAGELITIAEAGDKPRVDFRGGYGWQDLDIEMSQADGQVWTAGLFLSFPIFDGLRTRGKVTQARSNLSTLKIEEAKLKDAIALQTRDAVYAVREAGEIIKGLSGTVTQGERLLFMAEKGYEFGVKTRLDVDDAQLNLMQAMTSLARAKRDCLVARVMLTWVMGTIEESCPGCTN
jgi:outer membrane protein TolC